MFRPALKIGKSTTIILICCLSEQITSYEKLNLILTNSINLVYFSLKMQRKVIQTKLQHKFFLPCLKRNASQTLQGSSYKQLFPKCGYYCYSFNEWFSFHVINRGLFLIQMDCYSESGVHRNKHFGKSRYFMSVISLITFQCY